MIEALLFVAVGLAAIAVVRLGALLDRGAENRAVLEEMAQTLLGLDRRLQAFSEQVAEATRAGGERFDAVGRELAEQAQRSRGELVVALGSFHRFLVEALREMADLHERAVRGDRVPVRQALAIRDEIRRARDQRDGQAPGGPCGAEEAPASAGSDRGTHHAAPIRPEGQRADSRSRGFAALLSRVQGRTWQRRSDSVDSRAGGAASAQRGQSPAPAVGGQAVDSTAATGQTGGRR